MPEQNVEVVRRAFEAFNERDARALIRLCHPKVEFRSSLDAEGALYQGPSGVAEYFADLADAFNEEWRAAAEEFRVAPNDSVVLIVRLIGSGRLSGVPIERRIAHVWQLRDGLLWRGHVYLDPREALEAMGLQDG